LFLGKGLGKYAKKWGVKEENNKAVAEPDSRKNIALSI
jgi:hypothetical protein